VISSPAPSEPEPKESSGNCKVSKKYPEKITQWCNLITKQSKKNNLDPDLVSALIWQESGGNPQAYSKSGAVGLMQVMSRDGIAASFMCVNGPCFSSRPSMEELYKPTFNVKYGAEFLGNLVTKYGLRDGLKRYGPMNVGYYYADKVLGIYNNYKD
jgi:soluble lytic murein transglycosylase-like protein